MNDDDRLTTRDLVGMFAHRVFWRLFCTVALLVFWAITDPQYW